MIKPVPANNDKNKLQEDILKAANNLNPEEGLKQIFELAGILDLSVEIDENIPGVGKYFQSTIDKAKKNEKDEQEKRNAAYEMQEENERKIQELQLERGSRKNTLVWFSQKGGDQEELRKSVEGRITEINEEIKQRESLLPFYAPPPIPKIEDEQEKKIKKVIVEQFIKLKDDLKLVKAEKAKQNPYFDYIAKATEFPTAVVCNFCIGVAGIVTTTIGVPTYMAGKITKFASFGLVNYLKLTSRPIEDDEVRSKNNVIGISTNKKGTVNLIEDIGYKLTTYGAGMIQYVVINMAAENKKVPVEDRIIAPEKTPKDKTTELLKTIKANSKSR